jgi:predicted DNA-binding ribbon-helix-helix protein
MERRTTKRAVAAAAFAATLTGGALFGAVLGTPTTSGAQSSGETTTTTASGEDGAGDRPERGHHGFGFGGSDLSVAAEALGLTEDELRERLSNGDTLAEIAEAEGVAVDGLIDTLVEAGREAIDEAAADAKANLEDRVTDLVEEGLPGGDGFPGGHGPGPGHQGDPFLMGDLSTAAEALGLGEDELRERLSDGDTLAEIAESEGVEVDALVSALVDEATTRMDEAVADGDLDEDRAADMKDGLEERVRSFVEDGRPGPWGRPGR